MPETAEELVQQLNQLGIGYASTHPQNPPTANSSMMESIIREVCISGSNGQNDYLAFNRH